jgi:GalNAc-alpha-(1->4)-GalNAc-alpha-(1->3)-diNAcBac-PP-undecaprenol alpha-1,4-N-acetyl-D-galactosaminyltransferase
MLRVSQEGDAIGKALVTEEPSRRRPRSKPASGSRARRKLALVISHLGPGGAQRVVANAVQILAERGIDLHLIMFTDRADAYPTDRRATCHVWLPRGADDKAIGLEDDASPPAGPSEPVSSCGKPRSRPLRRMVPSSIGFGYELIRISAWLRRTLRAIEPDAVLSFLTQTNILTVLATRGLDLHTVISERNDPRLQRHRGRVELLRWLVYRWADVVTANSKGALQELARFVPADKLGFLPNPLMTSATPGTAEFRASTVITVGRLVEQKGLDVLLDAWARVVEALPGWRLAIVGGGPLAEALKAQAARLKIEDSVDWMGHVADPFPLLRGAELFILTSRFEGSPNALLEAMACGLPAIVSDASPGPCELVGAKDSAAGVVVPVEDAQATAAAILRLARNESLRRRFGLAARERVREHEADQAIEVWLRLLRCD